METEFWFPLNNWFISTFSSNTKPNVWEIAYNDCYSPKLFPGKCQNEKRAYCNPNLSIYGILRGAIKWLDMKMLLYQGLTTAGRYSCGIVDGRGRSQHRNHPRCAGTQQSVHHEDLHWYGSAEEVAGEQSERHDCPNHLEKSKNRNRLTVSQMNIRLIAPSDFP